MSNGGNFSFTLACGLSNRVASIASVTGLMFQGFIGDCTPTRPLSSVLHIHGTEDPIAIIHLCKEVWIFGLAIIIQKIYQLYLIFQI